MAKKNRGKSGKADWAEAKKRCRLSVEDVEKAKELGFSPQGLIKNIPARSEPWKLSVKDWIRNLYWERFRKGSPPGSADDSAYEARESEAALRGGNEVRGVGEYDDEFFGEAREDLDHVGDDELADERDETLAAREDGDDREDDESDDDPDEFPWDRSDVPSSRDIREEDEAMIRRQRDFQVAAHFITQDLAQIPWVEKVMLFGSCAAPLKKEVPRFREFRRAGIAVWHECGDVDLAVWVHNLDDLKALQRARGQALNQLLKERNIGVAHHQVDIHLLEPETNRYLGRLCTFGACPKGRPPCRVPECGKKRFLQQFEQYAFDRPQALAPDRSKVLFDREAEVEESDSVPF